MEPVSLAPEKPPAQQMKEHLERLAQGMQVLLEAQHEHQAALVLMADIRTSVTEALSVVHTQMDEVLHGLQILEAPAVPVPRSTVKSWMLGVGGILGGLLLMGGVWAVWPVSPLQGFAVALDAVISQQYPQLPKAAQESLAAVYKQHRYQGPGRGAK